MHKAIKIPTQIAENKIAGAKLTDHDTGDFSGLLHFDRLQVVRQNTFQLGGTDQIPRQTLGARLHLMGNLPQHGLFIPMIDRFGVDATILHQRPLHIPLMQQHPRGLVIQFRAIPR